MRTGAEMLKKAGSRQLAVPGVITSVDVDGDAVALYEIDGEVLATTDECPHAACFLSENGEIYGHEVECTCHGSSFDIRTGRNLNPPSAASLTAYRVVVENDELLVDIE
jgi:nitrite reductase/ring-hydroxylating ferredoxin subunit